MNRITIKTAVAAVGGSGVPISPQESAAALLITAVMSEDMYAENERDKVNRTIMNLFRVSSPAATKLRETAEAMICNNVGHAKLAEAARGLENHLRETLMTRLWELVDRKTGAFDGQGFVYRTADVWGMPRDRAKVLRNVIAKEGV